MTKLIISLLVACFLAATAPQIIYKHYHPAPVIKEFKPIVHKTNIHKKVVKNTKEKYYPPTGKPLEVATLIASKTGHSVDLISRIMFSESQYKSDAKHNNNNHTYDSGLMQINSSHIAEAEKMGIDIFTDNGNADMAIYLLNRDGLAPWNSSKSKWK